MVAYATGALCVGDKQTDGHGHSVVDLHALWAAGVNKHRTCYRQHRLSGRTCGLFSL